jgi:cation:H+ antiporter
MIVIWAIALVAGTVVAAASSRRAVAGALDIAEDLGLSKGFVGVTLVAIGTDLPEIANSISASITGHGDLNVGTGAGSALTQVTLIVAILIVAAPAIVRSPSSEDREFVLPVGAITACAAVPFAFLIRDDFLSRVDGLLLVLVWAVSMLFVRRWQRTDELVAATADGLAGRDVAAVLGWLALVGGSATLVVRAFVEITDVVGVPELIASTIVLALGTSLPELVVDLTAIRRGATALAIGDLFGSSLVDMSLSIGIGPVFRGTEVSSAAAVSVLLVGVGVAAATLAWRSVPRRPAIAATTFFGIYAVTTAAILLATT